MQSTANSKGPAPKSPRTSAKILAYLRANGITSTPVLSAHCHNGCKINQLLAQLEKLNKVTHIGHLTRPGKRPVSLWDIPRPAESVAPAG